MGCVRVTSFVRFAGECVMFHVCYGVFQWCQCVRACVLRGEEGTRVTADGFELVGERANLLF